MCCFYGVILVLHLALTCLISPIKDNLTHQSWSVSRPNSERSSFFFAAISQNEFASSGTLVFRHTEEELEALLLSVYFDGRGRFPIMLSPFLFFVSRANSGVFLNFHCQCQGSFLLTFTILLIERCIFRNIALYKRNFQKNKRESWPGEFFAFFFQNLHFKFFITMNKSCRWLG